MNDSPKQELPFDRFSADLSGLETDKIAIIKLGFFWHSIKGFFDFLRYTKQIENSTKSAENEWKLHKTEYFLFSANHAGLIQYWESFAHLEAWATKSREHLAWWKEMESGSESWKDLSIYHEVYLVEPSSIETVYNLNKNIPKSEYPGLSAFLPLLSPTEYRARKRFLKNPQG